MNCICFLITYLGMHLGTNHSTGTMQCGGMSVYWDTRVAPLPSQVMSAGSSRGYYLSPPSDANGCQPEYLGNHSTQTSSLDDMNIKACYSGHSVGALRSSVHFARSCLRHGVNASHSLVLTAAQIPIRNQRGREGGNGGLHYGFYVSWARTIPKVQF